MALYASKNPFNRASDTFQQATQTMGSRTKEGPRTEYEPAPPTPGQVITQGLGVVGTGKQLYGMGQDAYGFLAGLGAPDAAAEAASAGAGAAPATGGVQAAQAADLALPAVQALQRAGVISGMPDGSFRPREHMTREQACVVLSAL